MKGLRLISMTAGGARRLDHFYPKNIKIIFKKFSHYAYISSFFLHFPMETNPSTFYLCNICLLLNRLKKMEDSCQKFLNYMIQLFDF